MLLSQKARALQNEYRQLVSRPNTPCGSYNGIFTRWENPVLTRDHVPPSWRFDMNAATNPGCQERLPVNATFNSGALLHNGVYHLVVRVEGADRKSFFALAASTKPTEGFEFQYPILLPDTEPDEVNVYDMRLTRHEDGWIYGLFCSESKDTSTEEAKADPTAAKAACGICRTKDFKTWERLPNLQSKSPQQRNVVLFPTFLNGKYAFFTRPQDGFISAGGISYATCEDITNAKIGREVLVSPREYHKITESKNGAGATPIKTKKGWLHIAHGVRNTAAGLRYVLYVFVTDLKQPWKVTAAPSGYFLAPMGGERVGDVSNVVFSNGAALDEDTGELTIYYASSDTRLHALTTTIEKMLDYAFHTPKDPGRSVGCVLQRMDLIQKNEALLAYEDWLEMVPMNSVWRKELEALTAKPEERFEAFYKDIAFGTGGLRAVMGPGRNRINHFVVGRITQGLANYLNRHNPDKTPRVCIAFDTRNYGEAFARHTASVLCANGIKVMLFDQTRPTPMLSYAVRKHKADAGIVITASHNTKRYNGYKVYNATGGQLTGEAANEVTEEIERLDYFHDVKTMDRSEAENQGLLTLMKREMDDAYLADQKQWLTRPKYIRKNGNKIRILYTPLHGTGLLPVTSLLSELGFRDVHVVREQRDADGDFPTVYKPNPEDKNVFAIALEQAKSLKPDLIFATDPDADRLGVLSKGAGDAYEILTGTQLGALLTDYIIKARLDCENMPKNPAVVSTIVTGTLAEHICNANNVSYHKVLTGFKYIGEKMDEFKRTDKYSFLFGFEESYGYLTGDSCRDKDAVLTSALVSEAALWYKNEKDMTLWQAMQALYAEYRPVTERLLDYEFLGADGIKTMSAFMDNAREKAGKLIKGESVTFIEDYLTGERTDMSTGEQIKLTLPKSNVLKLFFADGAWLVLRPSGTEPKLKLYLCTDNAFSHGDSLADAEARLEALIDKTVKLLPPDARKHRKPA